MSLFWVGRKLMNRYPQFIYIFSSLYNFIGFNKIKVKGKNNRFDKSKSFLRKTNVKVFGYNNNVVIGEKCHLNNCMIYINGNNNKVYIGNSVYLKCTELYIEDNDNEIIIGNDCTVFGRTHLACIEGRKIIIGDDCMFSTDVVFRTGDSHSIIDKDGKRINDSKDILVGNHVWFGNKTIINKGVIIYDNSIIGTGAVVTKQFTQKGIILAGNPAKIIKENINWLRERV